MRGGEGLPNPIFGFRGQVDIGRGRILAAPINNRKLRNAATGHGGLADGRQCPVLLQGPSADQTAL